MLPPGVVMAIHIVNVHLEMCWKTCWKYWTDQIIQWFLHWINRVIQYGHNNWLILFPPVRGLEPHYHPLSQAIANKLMAHTITANIHCYYIKLFHTTFATTILKNLPLICLCQQSVWGWGWMGRYDLGWVGTRIFDGLGVKEKLFASLLTALHVACICEILTNTFPIIWPD